MDDIDPQPQPFNHLAAKAKDVEEAEAIVAEAAEITEVEEEEADVTVDDIDPQPQPFKPSKGKGRGFGRKWLIVWKWVGIWPKLKPTL